MTASDPVSTISVIVPCYNGAAFVADALHSIFDQTLPPTEVIVVDDGSTDGSADVIRGFEPLVRYIRQHNQGEPAARNRGLMEATGNLIAFLDADDLWPPQSVAIRAQALSADPNMMFAYGVTEQFVTAGCSRSPPGDARLAAPVAGATLYRRGAFDRVGLFSTEQRLGGMLDWFSRAIHFGARGCPIPEVVLRRRIHDSNSVHDEDRLKSDYLRLLRTAVRRNRAATQ